MQGKIEKTNCKKIIRMYIQKRIILPYEQILYEENEASEWKRDGIQADHFKRRTIMEKDTDTLLWNISDMNLKNRILFVAYLMKNFTLNKYLIFVKVQEMHTLMWYICKLAVFLEALLKASNRHNNC